MPDHLIQSYHFSCYFDHNFVHLFAFRPRSLIIITIIIVGQQLWCCTSDLEVAGSMTRSPAVPQSRIECVYS